MRTSRAYYHGINVLFLELAEATNYASGMNRARSLAQEILGYCTQAQNPKLKVWKTATEADALVVLGKWEDGTAKHREALKLVEKPWQAVSIEEQAIRLAQLLGLSEKEIEELADIYEGRQ